MCLFHKWDKWENFEKYIPKRTLWDKWYLCPAIEKWQRKKCSKCGMSKERYISQQVLK